MSEAARNVSSPQNNPKTRRLQYLAWTLSASTVTASLFAWGNNYDWHFLPFNAYVIFPLLGLMAFGLMWAHYMVGTLRDIAGAPHAAFSRYFKYTGYAVLILICLHPGLLIFQRFQDGYGLPPGSYETYVAPGLGWITLLGTASLTVFLAYELRRFFGHKSWWHFVTEAGDFAMLAILYHGFRLGHELRMPLWFQLIWLLYAITLIIVLVRSYRLKYFTKLPPKA